jgi:diguanylate cyclase (GGDEF)-like protein
MELSARALKFMQITLGVLLTLTVVLLLWQHYGMERVVELSAATRPNVQVGDDRGQGGASVATLAPGTKSLKMTCELVKKIEWPYCQFIFPLGEAAKGLDLSSFTHATFDIGYTGPGPHTLRNMLMNFEPAVSRVDDWMSPKINEVEFLVPADGKVTVPLNVYRTAGWWITQRNIPLENTDSRVDNVVRVELMTVGNATPGHHEIEIRHIRFHGKLITMDRLLAYLVGAWILYAVSWPLLAAYQMRNQLQSSRQRLALLGEINKALQLETKELVGQAHIDPLTGALNRQGLRAAMRATSSLLRDPLSVIFVDLDHFKRINDQHGHDVGDAVLRDFASTVSGEIRASDKLVRWGGEEFLIICPGTTAAQAYGLATKLRAAMPQHKWPVGLRVTASFGVASLNRKEEISAVINRADAALYKAKSNGRDRVEVAMDDEAAREAAPV